jgi:hypothetical protein
MALLEWAKQQQQDFLLRVAKEIFEPLGWNVEAAPPVVEGQVPQWKLMMSHAEVPHAVVYVLHGVVQAAEKDQHDGLLADWIRKQVIPQLPRTKNGPADRG